MTEWSNGHFWGWLEGRALLLSMQSRIDLARFNLRRLEAS